MGIRLWNIYDDVRELHSRVDDVAAAWELRVDVRTCTRAFFSRVFSVAIMMLYYLLFALFDVFVTKRARRHYLFNIRAIGSYVSMIRVPEQICYFPL